jgi:3-oxoacyl-[acyl-carrier protein] reductase
VTGATSGIGRATSLKLASLGANVFIHYHSNPDAAQQVVREIEAHGVRARAVQADFRDRDQVIRSMQALAGDDTIDILVNNAGTIMHRYLQWSEMPLEYWDDVLALNLSSVYWAVWVLYDRLADGARIVNVSSIAADNGGGPGAFAYAAAKGGVNTLTRGLAKALAPRQIRVNAVAPGVIVTPFHEKFTAPDVLQQVQARIPLKRLGTAEECAEVIAFLASPASSYVNGEIIGINGGQHLTT